MTDSELTQTRLSVARMEGMLTQALSDQGARISSAETAIGVIHGRLSDKGKMLATHSEQIGGLQRAINVIENDTKTSRNAVLGKITGIVGVIVGIGGLILAITNKITIG